MATLKQANYTLNISLHVLILFSFLTIFFFSFISHLEKKTVDKTLTSVINDKVGQLLDNIDKYDVKIDWNGVNNIAENIKKDATGELADLKKNHRNLLIVGITMITCLFAILSGLYVYFTLYKGINVSWKRILVENLITFSLVGLIEVAFFMKVASKYVPVTPDLLSKTILDRIKYQFIKYLDTSS